MARPCADDDALCLSGGGMGSSASARLLALKLYWTSEDVIL